MGARPRGGWACWTRHSPQRHKVTELAFSARTDLGDWPALPSCTMLGSRDAKQGQPQSMSGPTTTISKPPVPASSPSSTPGYLPREGEHLVPPGKPPHLNKASPGSGATQATQASPPKALGRGIEHFAEKAVAWPPSKVIHLQTMKLELDLRRDFDRAPPRPGPGMRGINRPLLQWRILHRPSPWQRLLAHQRSGGQAHSTLSPSPAWIQVGLGLVPAKLPTGPPLSPTLRTSVGSLNSPTRDWGRGWRPLPLWPEPQACSYSFQSLSLKSVRWKSASAKGRLDASAPGEREPASVIRDPCPRYPSTFCPGSKKEAGGWKDWHCQQGEIDFIGSGKKRAKFLRVPGTLPPSILFEFMVNEWHLPTPNLVISLVGEERNFPMKPWLRDILRKGLVKAMQSTGAWIFTSALRVGLARHVGQAVRDHSLASTSTKVKVITIGIVSLPRILNGEVLDNSQHENPIPYKSEDSSQGSLYSLDSNHSHFILVDPLLDRATGHGDPTTRLRLLLEKHISEQRTGYGGKGSIEIPVLCLLVNGGPRTLEVRS
ncbi:uncharacterized protein LOC141519365 [Macrotis lagotis]|uniref:uncharacterized protein LOC141519365 n=1 Tax=Macrotis lagotis TaxID=92651 RepID=UPI003D698642